MYEVSRFSDRNGFSRELVDSPAIDTDIFLTDSDVLAYRFVVKDSLDFVPFKNWVLSKLLISDSIVPEYTTPELVFLFKSGIFLERAVALCMAMRLTTKLSDVEIYNRILNMCKLNGLDAIFNFSLITSYFKKDFT